ncbi:MAG TPA: hypothetical protein VEA92_01040 [Candidatus Paceibacterota bacterium]|nr:hypothetical protein [Candidatus Paceibacterota bacterium]
MSESSLTLPEILKRLQDGRGPIAHVALLAIATQGLEKRKAEKSGTMSDLLYEFAAKLTQLASAYREPS